MLALLNKQKKEFYRDTNVPAAGYVPYKQRHYGRLQIDTSKLKARTHLLIDNTNCRDATGTTIGLSWISRTAVRRRFAPKRSQREERNRRENKKKRKAILPQRPSASQNRIVLNSVPPFRSRVGGWSSATEKNQCLPSALP